MLRLISLSILLVMATLSTRGLSVPSTTNDDFVSLFDGKSLKGWHGDKRLWKVQDGVIVGTSDGSLKSNTFLISDHSYENFVLKIILYENNALHKARLVEFCIKNHTL